ncbi:MAG: VTT domain-containing protein [Candidatus Woesearchaeota archaeon]
MLFNQMGQPELRNDVIFTYNNIRKKVKGILTIISLVLILSTIVYYVVFLRNSEFILIRLINFAIGHIYSQLRELTILGAFYGSFIGGIFFIFLPQEPLFWSFLSKGINPAVLFTIQIVGLTIAYAINYFIGNKLSGLSKRIISYKKFYKFKSLINKYGAVIIFIFNVLPLPSQALSTILGVFKYNKTRFFILFFSGQSIKYLVIIISFKLLT